MNKKILSILMTLMLAMSMLVTPVFAVEGDETTANDDTQTTETVSEEKGDDTDTSTDTSINEDSEKVNDSSDSGVTDSSDNEDVKTDEDGKIIDEPIDEPADPVMQVSLSGYDDYDDETGVYTVEINRGSPINVPLNISFENVGDEIEPIVTIESSNKEAVTVSEDNNALILSDATEIEPSVITITAEVKNNIEEEITDDNSEKYEDEVVDNDENTEDADTTETDSSVIVLEETIRINVEEWIPQIEEPDVTEKAQTVLYRETEDGITGEIKILEGDDLTALQALGNEEIGKQVMNGSLEIWNGWKYKKDSQEITTAADGKLDENERLVLKYGSGDFNLNTNGVGGLDYSLSQDRQSIDTVNEGVIKLLSDISFESSNIATITVNAAGDAYHKAQTRDIQVEVVKGDQTITLNRTSYNVPFGTANFNLGARSNDSTARLTYTSSNPNAVSVDASGNIAIRNVASNVVITVNSGETAHYNAAPARSVIITVTSPVAPALTAKAIGKKKVQLNWANVTGAIRYEIQPYLGKKALKSNSVVNRLTVNHTKLKKRKTYKYKIRAVVVSNGTTIYSPWSAVKSVKVK